jgi:hypothetical protein
MAFPLDGWPVPVDDIGDGQTGTVADAAFFDLMHDAIVGDIQSATNPTVAPKTITDEVIAARGSKASLDARLDVTLNEDGTAKTPADLAQIAEVATFVSSENVAINEKFDDWTNGAALAPDNWVLSGGGSPAIARCGAGEADTYTFGAGKYCARITYGTTTSAKLTQTVISTALFAGAISLRSRKFQAGAWLKSGIASHVRIVVDDGVTTTASAYHTGGGTAEFLCASHTLSSSASKLEVYIEVTQAGSAYAGGITLVFSNISPVSWRPKPVVQIFDKPARWRQDGTTSSPQTIGGGWVWSDVTEKANSGAGETDLHSWSIPANTLDVDGKVLIWKAAVLLTTGGNAKTIKSYVAGVLQTTIPAANVNNSAYAIEIMIMRLTASTVKICSSHIGTIDAAQGVTVDDTQAFDCTAANIVKITGQGGASNEIKSEFAFATLFG